MILCGWSVKDRERKGDGIYVFFCVTMSGLHICMQISEVYICKCTYKYVCVSYIHIFPCMDGYTDG